jgi:DNA-binding CsgD family transcriptional regulator
MITISNMVDLSEADSRKWSPLLTPVRVSVLQPSEDGMAPRSRTQVQRHLIHEDQLEVVDAYAAGASINEVARQFRLHRTTVNAILERHGVPVRARTMSPTQIRRARELYESGLSLVDVGAQLGFNAQTVANRLKALAVPIRAPHDSRQALGSPSTPPGR